MNYGDLWLVLTILAIFIAGYLYRAKIHGSYKPGTVVMSDPETTLDFFIWLLFWITLSLAIGLTVSGVCILALKSVIWFHALLNSL